MRGDRHATTGKENPAVVAFRTILYNMYNATHQTIWCLNKVNYWCSWPDTPTTVMQRIPSIKRENGGSACHNPYLLHHRQSRSFNFMHCFTFFVICICVWVFSSRNQKRPFIHRPSVKLIYISLNSLLGPTICLRKHKHFYSICIAFKIWSYNDFPKLGDDIQHKEYIYVRICVEYS
jgi:hypothetical protein